MTDRTGYLAVALFVALYTASILYLNQLGALPAEEALPILFDLVSEEGLVLGGSTAINVAGAIRLARELGPGKTIVTVLCDSGTRYQSKLFNPAFLKERNLPVPQWLDK